MPARSVDHGELVAERQDFEVQRRARPTPATSIDAMRTVFLVGTPAVVTLGEVQVSNSVRGTPV